MAPRCRACVDVVPEKALRFLRVTEKALRILGRVEREEPYVNDGGTVRPQPAPYGAMGEVIPGENLASSSVEPSCLDKRQSAVGAQRGRPRVRPARPADQVRAQVAAVRVGPAGGRGAAGRAAMAGRLVVWRPSSMYAATPPPARAKARKTPSASARPRRPPPPPEGAGGYLAGPAYSPGSL